MKSAVLPFALSLLVVTATVYGAFLVWRMGDQANAASREGASRDRVIKPVDRQVGDSFALTDQDGESFDSADLKGKVWVANFFFSNCPGPCFRLMSELSELNREFKKSDVHFVSITVDPKNDTPEALKKYGERFAADHERWTYLTGPIEKTSQIGQEIFKLPTADMAHSEKAVIMDRQGRMAAVFNVLKPDELNSMKKALRELLAEKPDVSAARSASESQRGEASEVAAE